MVRQRRFPCEECPFRVQTWETPLVRMENAEPFINLLSARVMSHACHTTPDMDCKGAEIFVGDSPQIEGYPVCKDKEEFLRYRK